MLTRIKTLLALPKPKRNAKIMRSLRNRTSLCLYKVMADWVNRSRTRFAIEFRPDSHYDFQRCTDYETLFQAWLAGNHYNNCGDLSRFYTIYLNLEQVLSEGVPGDFVELGVYKGNSACILANFARRQNRHVFLFDTFEGFDQRDLQGVDNQRPVQFGDTSLDAVRKLVGADSVTYVKGFFPDSVTQIRMPERIAAAHIDCDLYGPMRAGLEWFYPRLSPGGILMLHDYSSGYWPGVTKAVDEFFEHLPERPVLVPDKSGTAIIRKSGR
jgi:hypothetical protein